MNPIKGQSDGDFLTIPGHFKRSCVCVACRRDRITVESDYVDFNQENITEPHTKSDACCDEMRLIVQFTAIATASENQWTQLNRSMLQFETRCVVAVMAKLHRFIFPIDSKPASDPIALESALDASGSDGLVSPKPQA